MLYLALIKNTMQKHFLKFSKVLTVDEGEVIGEWKVSARDNMI